MKRVGLLLLAGLLCVLSLLGCAADRAREAALPPVPELPGTLEAAQDRLAFPNQGGPEMQGAISASFGYLSLETTSATNDFLELEFLSYEGKYSSQEDPLFGDWTMLYSARVKRVYNGAYSEGEILPVIFLDYDNRWLPWEGCCALMPVYPLVHLGVIAADVLGIQSYIVCDFAPDYLMNPMANLKQNRLLLSAEKDEEIQQLAHTEEAMALYDRLTKEIAFSDSREEGTGRSMVRRATVEEILSRGQKATVDAWLEYEPDTVPFMVRDANEDFAYAGVVGTFVVLEKLDKSKDSGYMSSYRIQWDEIVYAHSSTGLSAAVDTAKQECVLQAAGRDGMSFRGAGVLAPGERYLTVAMGDVNSGFVQSGHVMFSMVEMEGRIYYVNHYAREILTGLPYLEKEELSPALRDWIKEQIELRRWRSEEVGILTEEALFGYLKEVKWHEE